MVVIMINWIELAKEVHGDNYDYSNATVKNSKITYLCKKHGVITQSVSQHVRNRSKCRECWVDGLNGKLRLSNQSAIKMLRDKHGGRYDYTLVEYRGNKKPVKIICASHGLFEQRFDHHRDGAHCQECANEVRSQHLLHSVKDFVNQSITVHGNKYSYHDVVSIQRKTKVSIFCNECESTFKQRVDIHLNGHGCPSCNTGEVIGFKKSEFVELARIKNNGNAIFYIIKCYKDEEVFYKVGITTNSINVRYKGSKMPYGYDIIKEIKAEANKVWELEKECIRKNTKNHYTPLMPFNGYAKECFSKLVGAI